MKKIVKILLVALAVVTLAVSITACDFDEKIPAPTGRRLTTPPLPVRVKV